MKRPLLAGACLLPLVSACMVGPDYVPPASGITGNWTGEHIETSAEAQPVTAWWQVFGDPVLERIIADTATHNLDIRIALANIERARALRAMALGPIFPRVDANAQGMREAFSDASNRNRFNAEQERDNFSTSLDALWELDFFGRIRRSTQAADARLEAFEENRRDMLMAVLAETAQSYFTVRGLQKRLAVLRHNVELFSEVEDVARSQYESGIVTEFDYLTAAGERKQVEASLPMLEAELAAAIYRLSVLAGKDPRHYVELLAEQAPMPAPPDLIPVGLRSELLRRRPDIRRAERELAASNEDIGVAISELFPRITLNGSIGTSGFLIDDVFSTDGLGHRYGVGLALPLFRGGALSANIDAAKAANRASLLEYEKAVLLALEEAETSLERYGREWQTLERLQAAERQRQEAYRIARLRYESGQENFLIMLEAERTLVAAQDQTIESEIRILSYLTQLYKALGGGWEAFEAETAGPADTTPETDAS